MKLKNKKTGEIIDLNKGSITDVGLGTKIQLQATDRYNKPIWVYDSLAELNEVWEDYEEPKPQVVYYIDRDGEIVPYKNTEYPKRVFNTEQNKEIGNYFETKKEAERAVERLRAWKRLRDKGFEFCGWCEDIGFRFAKSGAWQTEVQPDLDLLFGVEE